MTKKKEILCYKCNYYSITRYGNVCNFDGTYAPLKTECPHYREKEDFTLREN